MIDWGWLLEHPDVVTWALAAVAATAALGAAYLQGAMALQGVYDQLAETARRETEAEARERDAFKSCLLVDIAILQRRMAANREDVQNYDDGLKRDAAATAPILRLATPDTIETTWAKLALAPPAVVPITRGIMLDIMDLRDRTPPAASDAYMVKHRWAEQCLVTITSIEASLAALASALSPPPPPNPTS